ncbi:MAG TPA: hypothetical protein GXX37_13370 [Clostridiaceae bacterium]|nr:hypothetical protein [Clostridiaceae bacterium]
MVSGDSGKETIRAVTFPHFPTIQQAIVWRNWEMVPVDRLAKVLETTEENILELAAGLGLDVPPNVNKYWLERGYITLIRQNWHLLTYEQILTLLDWTDEKLQFTLKEDDFLYHKLGMFKPYVEKAIYRPLTEEENARTEELREILKKHFPGNQHINSNTAKPFDFLKKFTTTAYSHSTNILDIPLSDMPRLYKFAERFLRKVASKWGMILEIADMENILEKVKKNESVYNMTISLAKANKDKRQENLYINLEVKPDKTMPAESHKIEIEDKVINITSVDEEGILRGLQWLEKQFDVKDNSFILKNYPTKEIQCRIGNYYHQEKDEENIYNDNKHSKFSCPNAAYETNKLSVPMEEQKRSKKTITRKTRFEIRYVYSYFAVYGDPLLDPNIDPYPEGLLESLSEMGVNGVWLQAVLYTLVPWDKAPELSKGWKKRIEGLKSIVKRAADYGIGVYLYFNEPRAMPEEFFVKHPEWKGAGHYDGLYSLCTSHKDIQEYLRNGTARLFTEVPDLAGIFTITMSENHTNCYSHNPPGKKPDCPRCSKRSQAEVIAEVNNIIAEGVHSVKPDARVIAWTWGWHPEWSDEAISLLNKDVILMCTAEEAIPTNIGGIKGQVVDYTMSIPGPGQRAINNWKKAAELGHKTMAKVQFNVTWECSAVPFLPVMNLLYQYLKGLDNSGVSGMQLSWTLGGYPSLNLEFASQLYWDDDNSILPGLYEFAVQKYGIKAAPNRVTGVI